MWLLPMFTVCGTQREIYVKLIIVKFILKASRGSLSCNRSVKAGIVRVTPHYKKKTQVIWIVMVYNADDDCDKSKTRKAY